MHTFDLTPEAFRLAAAAIPADVSIVMLNLLRFRDQADYAASTPEAPCTGREAYHLRYAPAIAAVMQRHGARVAWLGPVLGALIAPPDERWDEMMLVDYPSFSAFRAMLADPEYQAAVHHRMAALEDSRLIATTKATR